LPDIPALLFAGMRALVFMAIAMALARKSCDFLAAVMRPSFIIETHQKGIPFTFPSQRGSRETILCVVKNALKYIG
jgi:hypothetical protein